jgi:hypothetical protein
MPEICAGKVFYLTTLLNNTLDLVASLDINKKNESMPQNIVSAMAVRRSSLLLEKDSASKYLFG